MQSIIYKQSPQQYIVETDLLQPTQQNLRTSLTNVPILEQNLKLSNSNIQPIQLSPEGNLKLSNSNVKPILIETSNPGTRLTTMETPQSLTQTRISLIPGQQQISNARQSIAITTQANQYVAQADRKTVQYGDKQIPIVAKIVEQVPIIEKVNVIQKVQPIEYQQQVTEIDIHHECKIIILNLQRENAYLKGLLAQQVVEEKPIEKPIQPVEEDKDKDPKKKKELAKRAQKPDKPVQEKVPFIDDLERLKKELLDRNDEIDDLKRQNKELNLVLQDLKLQFDVAQNKVLDYERIVQIKEQENQEWKIKYEQFDARIKNIFIQIEQNRNDDLMRIIEVKTEENSEVEQRYAHLAGQLSDQFKEQLMAIVILNIENDRLHRILREGIEENKILKNRADKMMVEQGYDIIQNK